MTGIYGINYSNNYSLTGNYGYGYSTGAVSSAQPEEKGMVVNPGKSDVEKPGRKSSPAECETCKNRKYQDGSNEMVSFKSASHISPQASSSRVRAHEQEHVTNAYNKAAQNNGKVLSATVSLRTAVCPECGTPLVKYEGEAKHYCPNQSHCRPQILGRIIHFIRRKAMDIEGLGEETVELLFENGLLHDIADLYDLRAEQLACLPRLGEKSAENIIRSIRGSVEVPFQRVLFALGIRFVGETTAKYLAAHFRTLDAVMHATREELIEADEVGGKIADAIIDYFADAENLRIIERLRKAGLQTEAAHKALESESLAGKNFVITGRFSGHSRDELKELIEAHGGKNLAAVSANVDFLVAGEKIGPAKLQKATKLGVRLISEEELLAMIASGGTLPVTENASDGNTSAAPPSAQETTDKTDGGNTEQGSLF